MAEKPTLNNVAGGAQLNASKINENFDILAEKFEEVLGTAGINETGNTIAGDLDLDGNVIRNSGTPVRGNDLATVSYINSAINNELGSGFVTLVIQQAASAGQTVFDISPDTYTVGADNLIVKQNNNWLDVDIDYTETDSSTITLVSGATAGDNMEFRINAPLSSSEAWAATAVSDSQAAQAAAENAQSAAEDAQTAAESAQAAAEAAADTLPEIGAGDSEKYLRVNTGETAFEFLADTAVFSDVVSPNVGYKDIVFTSSDTYTPSADITHVDVIVVGGGGGGGGGYSNTNAAGSGGAGGGKAIKRIEAADLGATETVTVGAGGDASTSIAQPTNGGSSSFGAHCSATGGAAGANRSNTSSVGAGDGGDGTGGDVNISGNPGGVGNGAYLNRGGFSGGTPGESGGQGQSGDTGFDGTRPGEGGSGGRNDGSNRNGGAGFRGEVRVREWFLGTKGNS